MIKWKRTNVVVVAAVVASTIVMAPPMVSEGPNVRAATLALGASTTLYGDDGKSSSKGNVRTHRNRAAVPARSSPTKEVVHIHT